MYPHEPETQWRETFSCTVPFLDKTQQRIVAARKAFPLGYGGISVVSRASGWTMPTVRAAPFETN
jgi:hypothetical protein